MILDNKGKLFGKINIIDLIIILVILIGIIGVSYKFTKSKTVSPFVKETNVTLKFYCEEVHEIVASHIKVNDPAKDYQNASNFGIVKRISTDKSFAVGQNQNGEYVKTSKPDHLSMDIEIDGKGVLDNGGITIDNNDYYIGKTIYLRAGDSVVTAKLFDIFEKEK